MPVAPITSIVNPLGSDLFGPNFKADQGIGPKRLGNRDVSSVTSLSNQYTSNPWDVVTRIECVPTPANVGFEPSSEIPWGIWGRHAYVPQIAGAVSCRNVHAAAESNGQMRVVATNALALVEHVPGRLGCARVLVAKLNVIVDKIANRLNARPSGRLLLKELPRDIGQLVGFAIATAKKIHDRLCWQVLDRVLGRRGHGDVRQACVANDTISRQAHSTGRSNDTAAPVTEAITVWDDRN